MKPAIILFALLGTVLVRDVARGCGPGFMAEDYRFWLLQPQLAEMRELHPFRFTSDLLAPIDEDLINDVAHATNISEWQATLGPGIPEADIRDVLYGNGASYSVPSDSTIVANAFLQRLRTMKDQWLPFIAFAKTCEIACREEDPWGFGGGTAPIMSKAWQEGEKILKRAKDPMLRARIAYQMVRISFYDWDGASSRFDANPVYTKHLLPLHGETWLEPSASFYLASMLPNPQRDLAYARIFGSAADKRFRMVQLFETMRAEEYLPLADDDRQRAMLLVMRDLQLPGRTLEDLERIASWDPHNAFLPMLLCREVNKLEDWLLTPELTEFSAAIRQWQDEDERLTREEVMQGDLEYLHRVHTFISGVLPHTTPAARPTLLTLQGHMHLIAGETAECMALMPAVDADPASSDAVRFQAGMDRVLAGVLANDRLTESTRNDILRLVQIVNDANDDHLDRNKLLDELHLYLGKKLIERGELAEGAFLLARSGRLYGTINGWWGANARHVVFAQATPADYDRMIALVEKKNKTPFEHYLVGIQDHGSNDDASQQREEIIAIDRYGWSAERSENRFTRNTLLDYKATWYIERDRLEEALPILRQVADTYWTEYPYALFKGDDPFVVDLYDPHNYNNQDSAGVEYTKHTIIERMVDLKREAVRYPRKRAQNNYLLGNAYFNMTWHGKYWIMTRISWSIHDFGGYMEQEHTESDENYFGCERAKEYYMAAQEAALDPVLQALACRMAVECESMRLDYEDVRRDEDWADNYLGMLNEKAVMEYSNIESCASYENYVRRYR